MTLHDSLIFTFVKLMRSQKELESDDAQVLTKACLLTKAVSTERLIDFHISHLESVEFDPSILTDLLKTQCQESKARLVQQYKTVKLSRDGFSAKQIVDRIELCNILAGVIEAPLTDAEFVNAVFLHCFQTNISMTFFRLKSVLLWLGALV